MYSPSQARWISEDPIRFDGGDPNLYRFVGNDPINAVDPSGLFQEPVSASKIISAPWQFRDYAERQAARPDWTNPTLPLGPGDLVIISGYSPVDEPDSDKNFNLKYPAFQSMSKIAGYTLSPFRPKTTDELKLALRSGASMVPDFGGFRRIVLISHTGTEINWPSAELSPGNKLYFDSTKRTHAQRTAHFPDDLSLAFQEALAPNGILVLASCGYLYERIGDNHIYLGKQDPLKMQQSLNDLKGWSSYIHHAVYADPALSQPNASFGSTTHLPSEGTTPTTRPPRVGFSPGGKQLSPSQPLSQ
jgi:hypothetical protein